MRLGERMQIRKLFRRFLADLSRLMWRLASAVSSRKDCWYGPASEKPVCLHVIAEVQKKGGAAAFIDANTLDPQRRGRGVKLDELLISQPDNGEQALEITETLIRSGAVDVIVVDSVSRLFQQNLG